MARRWLAEDHAVAANKKRYPDTVMAYVMIAPIVILLGIFVIYPALQATVLSFYNWSFYQESEFVGLKNFTAVPPAPKSRASILLGLRSLRLTRPARRVR